MYRFFGRFMRSINHTRQMYFVGIGSTPPPRSFCWRCRSSMDLQRLRRAGPYPQTGSWTVTRYAGVGERVVPRPGLGDEGPHELLRAQHPHGAIPTTGAVVVPTAEPLNGALPKVKMPPLDAPIQ